MNELFFGIFTIKILFSNVLQSLYFIANEALFLGSPGETSDYFRFCKFDKEIKGFWKLFPEKLVHVISLLVLCCSVTAGWTTLLWEHRKL